MPITVFRLPHMMKAPYDPMQDFTWIVHLVGYTFGVVVRADSPHKTWGDVIAYAKANPGKLTYASSGIGTPPHLAGELFKSTAGLDVLHVPYREANSALNAVVGGTADMMFSIASTAQSQIGGGTVRGVAVTSREPSPLVPGVPAIAQSGLPGFEVIGWNGFVAPRGTPPSVIAALSSALQAGLDDGELRKKLTAAGYETASRNTPEQFGGFIRADTAKWVDLVARTNMKGN
jgi:tripartite-type tricarboxylate transporter receptor subunit TctC